MSKKSTDAAPGEHINGTGFIALPQPASAAALARLRLVPNLTVNETDFVGDDGASIGGLIGVPVTNGNPGAILFLIRTVAPDLDVEFYEDFRFVPLSQIEVCRGPGLQSPLSEDTSEKELNAALGAAASKLVAAHGVLNTLLDLAVSTDGEYVARGADDAGLTKRRIDLLKAMAVIEDVCAELKGDNNYSLQATGES